MELSKPRRQVRRLDGSVWIFVVNSVTFSSRFIIARLMKLEIKSALDVGAGPGLISKFIYSRFEDAGCELDLTYLENSNVRVALMKRISMEQHELLNLLATL
jgi:16S rRNA G1207 methylase RsmC